MVKLVIIIVIILSVVFIALGAIPSYMSNAAKTITSFIPVVEFDTLPCMHFCLTKLSNEERSILGSNLFNISSVQELPTYFSCNYQLLELAALAWEYGRFKMDNLDINLNNLNCSEQLNFTHFGISNSWNHCDIVSNVSEFDWYISNDSKSGFSDNHDYSDFWLWKLVNMSYTFVKAADYSVVSALGLGWLEWLNTLVYYATQGITLVHNITIRSPVSILLSRAKLGIDTVDVNVSFAKFFPSAHITGSQEGGVLSVTELGAFGNATQYLFNCFNYGYCDNTKSNWCHLDFFTNFGCGYTFKDFCKVDREPSNLPYVSCTDHRTLNDIFNPHDAVFINRPTGDIDNDFVCKYNPPYDACNTEFEKYQNETTGCQPAWSTLLTKKGNCQDFALMYYTAFRTLGVQESDLNLDIGVCDLPCSCKALFKLCPRLESNLSVHEDECFTPAKLNVAGFGEIDVCSDPILNWNISRISALSGFDVVNNPTICVDDSCLRLYDHDPSTAVYPMSEDLLLETTLVPNLPCKSIAITYCKPGMATQYQCSIGLIGDYPIGIVQYTNSGSWEVYSKVSGTDATTEIAAAGGSNATRSNWHSILTEYDCGLKQFRVSLDRGNFTQWFDTLNTNPGSLKKLTFLTYGIDSSYEYYIDGIAFSDVDPNNDYIVTAETAPLIKNTPERVGGKFTLINSSGSLWTVYQNYTGSYYARYYYSKTFDNIDNDRYRTEINDGVIQNSTGSNDLIYSNLKSPCELFEDITCTGGMGDPCNFLGNNANNKSDLITALTSACSNFIENSTGFGDFVNNACGVS